MPKFFTLYWTNDTYEKHRLEQKATSVSRVNLLSNLFTKRGVGRGDFLYSVTVIKGSLYLFGRSKVTAIESWESYRPEDEPNQWEEIALVEEQWPAERCFENQLPLSITERIECIDRAGDIRGLTFEAPGWLDQQTLRHLRQLTPASATLLDLQLAEYESQLRQATEDLGAYEAEVYGREGAAAQRLVNQYERDKNLRAAAVHLHGLRCCVCQFSFEDVYGDHGAGYIEVHHTRPLASYKGEEIDVNPRTDMVVLCANCHRMIHRKRDNPLTVDELRRIYEARNAQRIN